MLSSWTSFGWETSEVRLRRFNSSFPTPCTTVGHYTTEGTVQQWDTILQMVQYNTETIYYRSYSTIVGHYNTEGTVQHWDNILQKVSTTVGHFTTEGTVKHLDTILQKVHYNSGTLYCRCYITTLRQYTTEGTVQ